MIKMKKNKMKEFLIISLLVISVTPFITNYSNASQTEEKPHFRFGYFYYGLFQNFDPVVTQTGSVAWMFQSHVVESLFSYNYFTGEWDDWLGVGFEQNAITFDSLSGVRSQN